MDIPARLLEPARDSGTRGPRFSREYPRDEARRDARVSATFRAAGIPVTARAASLAGYRAGG